MLPLSVAFAAQQQTGAIRGLVSDKDFDTPLAAVQVTAIEIGQTVISTDQGHFVFAQIPVGKYTLVFSKEGYVRQVKADVVVTAGQLTDVDVRLSGEFTEMDEFVVQDVLHLGAGTETALLKLRFDSPGLMDSIGADMMSRAGAGDAASALRLVAGASVQDGKYAVVRGLPDRYVNSQMNAVRLPTADEDKRAVELDQFPAAVIESIQVTKTFTPDQQGDASGGAVNLRLRGIPKERIFQIKTQVGVNSQVAGKSDFLTYEGGGVDLWGKDGGDRDIQLDNVGESWDGAVGVARRDAPIDFKWSGTLGGTSSLEDDVRVGGFVSVFYERDNSYFDDGTDDSYWVENAGDPMTPQYRQGTPFDGDFKTALFDVQQSRQSVQWGALGGLGIENEAHSVTLTALYTRQAEDVATLAEDTRGKAHFDPGNTNPDSAPFIRLETLSYTERTTGTLQLHGRHELPCEGFDFGKLLTFKKPEVQWTIARSSAGSNQPDKRQFGSMWKQNDTFPDGVHLPFKPAENFNLGNLQRIWREIEEDSTQFALDVKLPFQQWDEHEGYLKLGWFDDQVDRRFNQDTFSNPGGGGSYAGDWEDYWSRHFPFQDHPVEASNADVDYTGEQKISAVYSMTDMPLSSNLNVIGGARLETTRLSIVNDPESDALWLSPDSTQPQDLDPGEADADFVQHNLLPALGLEYRPHEKWTLRGSYSETVARQTFKEMTPILQQEYLGGPVFVGNPELEMSGLQNYDLRADYAPYEGGLVSASWFQKDIQAPIEYVQRLGDFPYTTAVNYPEGELSGYELEARQSLGRMWDPLKGFSLGANATFIESEVTLPADEAAQFDLPGIDAPMSSRDMANAPEHLYNLYLTFDWEPSGTQLGLFYTVQGDTLVAGAGQAGGNFVPSVYAKEFDTLNFSVAQKLGGHVKLQLQAKNLTNPEIEEVYRSKYIGDDVRKTSYTRGIEFSLGLSVDLSF